MPRNKTCTVKFDIWHRLTAIVPNINFVDERPFVNSTSVFFQMRAVFHMTHHFPTSAFLFKSCSVVTSDTNNAHCYCESNLHNLLNNWIKFSAHYIDCIWQNKNWRIIFQVFRTLKIHCIQSRYYLVCAVALYHCIFASSKSVIHGTGLFHHLTPLQPPTGPGHSLLISPGRLSTTVQGRLVG